jgi:hypothetical protein
MPASNDSTWLGPLLDAVAAENAIRDEVARAVHDEIVQVAAAARLVLDQAHRGPGGPASDEWYARLCDLLEHIRRNGVLVWHELRFGHLGQRDLPQVLREWARGGGRPIEVTGDGSPQTLEIGTVVFRAVHELFAELEPRRARLRLVAGDGRYSFVLRGHGCAPSGLALPALALCRLLGATVVQRRRRGGCLIAVELPDPDGQAVPLRSAAARPA